MSCRDSRCSVGIDIDHGAMMGFNFRIRFDLEGGCFCGRVQYNRHNDNNSYNGLR